MNITNQQVTEYLNGFYRCLDEDLEILRETGERDNVPIILRETEAVLSLLLSLKRPKRILEIGTAIGYSAVYFAKKCPDGYDGSSESRIRSGCRRLYQRRGKEHPVQNGGVP